MPFITVSVEDPHHPNHDECVLMMDESGIADWDDFRELFDDEEVELDFDEWIEWRDENGF